MSRMDRVCVAWPAGLDLNSMTWTSPTTGSEPSAASERMRCASVFAAASNCPKKGGARGAARAQVDEILAAQMN